MNQELLQKFILTTRSLPKLVCFLISQQNISAYNYKSLTLFPEIWFTPIF